MPNVQPTQIVPIIYTPPVQRPVVPWPGRLLALAVAGAALAVLIVGVTLAPSAGGMATHRQMGFPPCQFLVTSNLPCPTCGMTTSFAWFVRGNWLASLYVQPMGFVLALITGTCFWAGIYIAVTGRPIQRLLQQVPMVMLVCALVGLGIAAWGWKIFIHLRGMDGWR